MHSRGRASVELEYADILWDTGDDAMLKSEFACLAEWTESAQCPLSACRMPLLHTW